MEADLKLISNNILNWYNFEDVVNILKIEKDFKFDREDLQQYDYIILIGTLPYVSKENNMTSKEFIDKISKFLKDTGKLLIAVDNKFAIRYFVGNSDEYLNKKFSVLLNYSNEPDKIETYTKQKLKKILNECGFKGQNFYYPLPDYRLPNVIFSDKEMPKYNTIDKYIPYHNENATILIDEIDLFREILKNDENMFTFFANSFLIEASKQIEPISYKYISYNNVRKSKYRLITKIGDEYVEKDTIENESLKHYEQIKENIKILNDANINTVDEISDGKIRSLFINNENLLSTVLAKKLEENNIEAFYNIIDGYIDELKKVSSKMNDKEKTIFEEYKIEITEEQSKNLHFVKTALWDMTFKNCFYIDNKYYFFDQEWKANNMPIEYVLYRAILYTISLRRFINIQDIFEKYHLVNYLEIFKSLDEKLQEEIRDENLWNYYNKNYNFDIDLSVQEMNNMKVREKAKDLAIENLEKQIKNLQEEKVSTFIRRKINKNRRKN